MRNSTAYLRLFVTKLNMKEARKQIKNFKTLLFMCLYLAFDKRKQKRTKENKREQK